MAQWKVARFLCLFGLCKAGLSALVETQPTVMAAVGEVANLSCPLKTPEDVQQVTWLKNLPDGKKERLASYDKELGRSMNPKLKDKMEFIFAGLPNACMVIKNVTEEDGGCYQCLFNNDPEAGAEICLKLYELHGPVLHVRELKSPSNVVVSCSATGRPAPTVTLTVPRYSSYSFTNTNGSVTVTATAVVPCLRDNSTLVGCAVEVPSVPKKEVSTVIPEVKVSSDYDFTRIIVPSCVCLVVAAIIIFLIRRSCKKRDTEEITTPQTTDPQEAETSLMTQENELRQRFSVRNKKYDDPKAATPSGRCQPSPDTPFRDTETVELEQNGLKT